MKRLLHVAVVYECAHMIEKGKNSIFDLHRNFLDLFMFPLGNVVISLWIMKLFKKCLHVTN